MDNNNNSFPSYKKIFFIVTAASVSAYFAYQKFYKPKSNNEKKDYTSNIDQLGIKRHHL
tara:strand:- start:431 stop:607 length:177 start_codon:yes stop_codon:yes gene_type:complete